MLAADAKVDVADALGLLAFYGAESAGSLMLYDEVITENEMLVGAKPELKTTLAGERHAMKIKRLARMRKTQCDSCSHVL